MYNKLRPANDGTCIGIHLNSSLKLCDGSVRTYFVSAEFGSYQQTMRSSVHVQRYAVRKGRNLVDASPVPRARGNEARLGAHDGLGHWSTTSTHS